VIRVLLADDQSLIRAGFRALLDAEDDLEVVGEAADGEDAVRQTVALRPDVALVDVQMPVLDGIGATKRIAAGTGHTGLGGTHVVILTNYALDEYVFAALRAGACGFLVKDTQPTELLHAVRVAAAGDALLSPTVTRRLIAEFSALPPGLGPAPDLAVLTPREREILALVAGGLSNEEIAARVSISPATAKTHVSRVMVKLRARDRAQLVVMAYESGLVTVRGRLASLRPPHRGDPRAASGRCTPGAGPGSRDAR
jgi:DNA-binding NarL/FixJ family response regulator